MLAIVLARYLRRMALTILRTDYNQQGAGQVIVEATACGIFSTTRGYGAEIKRRDTAQANKNRE